jgi:hypothetical protein
VADLEYQPVPHDRESFLRNAGKRKGFKKIYKGLEEEYDNGIGSDQGNLLKYQ